jgi:hypothetical protein
MPLYQRYADAAGFPALETLYVELGIEIEDGQVRLTDDAPLSSTRRQIMHLDDEAARRRHAMAER